MNIVSGNNQFNKILEDHSMVLAYFSGEKCNVCASLKPKIEQMVQQQFSEVKFVEIPTEISPELTSRFSVYSVPVVMFFVEGKEYIREARNISITELTNKMDHLIRLYNE